MHLKVARFARRHPSCLERVSGCQLNWRKVKHSLNDIHRDIVIFQQRVYCHILSTHQHKCKILFGHKRCMRGYIFPPKTFQPGGRGGGWEGFVWLSLPLSGWVCWHGVESLVVSHFPQQQAPAVRNYYILKLSENPNLGENEQSLTFRAGPELDCSFVVDVL